MKIYVYSIVLAILLALLVYSLPTSVPDPKVYSSASILSSLLSKINSVFSGGADKAQNNSAKLPSEDCVPPISPKPKTGKQGKLGTLKITPEITENASNGSSITVTLTTSTPADRITLNDTGSTASFGRSDIIDWGPKSTPGNGANNGFIWGAGKDPKSGQKIMLPAGEYWVKLNIKYGGNRTVESNQGSYGWSGIASRIDAGLKISESFQWLYIGGNQRPDLMVTRVGEQTDPLKFQKPMELAKGESFNVQAISLGQAGNMSLSPVDATATPSQAVFVAANTSTSWKLTPIGNYVVIEPTIENTCGKTMLDKITVPIKFKAKEEPKIQAIATGMAITADRDFSTVREGEVVRFTAWLKMSDGSKKMLKTNVTWNIDDTVGTIDASGVFTPKLHELISEEGYGFGTVTATYRGENGSSLNAKTQQFRIEPAMNINTDDNSG